jgi:sulfotransferase family protein
MSGGRVADLVIAGVPKAGTSSLFAYLAQHPDICGSDEKEVGYFNYFNPRRHAGPPPPIEEYARHFAHASGERYALEATPTYSYGGRPVIDAMRRLLGKPRIIITLRDPAERLWSAYTFQRSVGNNAGIGSFQQYLDVVTARRRDGSDLVPHDGLHGLHIGYYADYVGEWFDEFGDDLKIVFVDDLGRDPRAVVHGLFEWLEIDPEVAAEIDLGARNTTRHPRSPRLAQTARALKKRSERLHLLPPAAQTRLRRAYDRLNSGGELPERFEPALRRQVEDLYRDSNRQTAEVLTAHGYSRLPAWLAGSAA